VAPVRKKHQRFASPENGRPNRILRWWRACGVAVKKAVHQLNAKPDEMRASAFGQMHGAVMLEKRERHRPAIICETNAPKTMHRSGTNVGLAHIIPTHLQSPLTISR